MYVTYDDFNDNSFDTSKWTHTKLPGVELYERNQRLEFVWTGEVSGFVGDRVISAKVFAFNVGKEYEIGVTVVVCGDSAGLVAVVDSYNYYGISISSRGELSVVCVINGSLYPLKSIIVGKTSGKLAIGVTNSEVYFKFDGNEVYRETYRLPSRSVNIVLLCTVSDTNTLAAFDDAYFATTEIPAVTQLIQMFTNLMPLFMIMMMLVMFTSFIRTLKE